MQDTPPKAAIVTLGCPMNQVDSENIIGGLVSRGFEIVPEEEAEIIVVNTCGFIGDAREESIETILSVDKLREHGNLRSLIVAGCLAQRYRSELKRDLSEADAVIGLDDREKIPDLCLELLGRKILYEPVYTKVVTGPRHTAYLRISEGCDNTCTYCTIPMIRGPFRSMPEEKIISDAAELVSTGASELVIIGQDTTRYGSDIGGDGLHNLLGRLSEVDGVEWLRLMYTHPDNFPDELIEAIGGLPEVLPYIDIPVQHISERVLRCMGRKTSPGHIRSLLGKIRDRIDGVVLRTSLIVGFPGETDADFSELVDFVNDIQFERLGAFLYSPEEGTPALKMDGEVSDDVAQDRYNTLMEAQAGISERFQTSLIGREFDMIIDSSDPETRTVSGRSYMDAPDIDGNIFASGSVESEDAYCRVRITGSETYDLTGEVI